MVYVVFFPEPNAVTLLLEQKKNYSRIGENAAAEILPAE